MKIMTKVKMEALKKEITLKDLSILVGIRRESMYYHVKKGTPDILRKIEEVLSLPENFF